MAKKGVIKQVTPALIKEIKDRIRRTGEVESIYKENPRILSRETYLRLRQEDSTLNEEIEAALLDYKRSQPEYFINLSKACVEDYLTCHKNPRTTTSRTKRMRYISKVDPKTGVEELVLDSIEESETVAEVILRCPPKIIEMIMPAIPRTTIDVLATQMANEGILPQKKAEVIMAIADQAQTNIREVLSGGLIETEE